MPLIRLLFEVAGLYANIAFLCTVDIERRRKRKLQATRAAKTRQPVPGGLSDLKIGVLGCMAERLKVRT